MFLNYLNIFQIHVVHKKCPQKSALIRSQESISQFEDIIEDYAVVIKKL